MRRRPVLTTAAATAAFLILASTGAQAARCLDHDDVPVGAVVVRGEEVIGTGRNERELRQDPTAHAELLALRAAEEYVGRRSSAGAGTSGCRGNPRLPGNFHVPMMS